MPSELKPCPFCGAEAKIGHGSYGVAYAFCVDGCVTFRTMNTKEEAIAAWNTRPQEAQMAMVETLRKALSDEEIQQWTKTYRKVFWGNTGKTSRAHEISVQAAFEEVIAARSQEPQKESKDAE